MIAALYVQTGGVYFGRDNVDPWDEARDARLYDGPWPVVSHPPCRTWSVMRNFSRLQPGMPEHAEEQALGLHAVAQVRKFGGVLEQPAKSGLWQAANIPASGKADAHGFSFEAPQFWWGHRARKNTWFYIVGCRPRDMPRMPLAMGSGGFVVSRCKGKRNPLISRRERSATPPAMADWLIELAHRCARG
jgi:hypothetical protein